MSKTYSNRALPPGTILREWRLEEVLGVGGFGIVYRGRGIYFDELVAIKEYFPGSISEREADDTVVPIDSDVEEVHALGLKKFVEEAKLLWNLSTPTRHPNIVNVRSLFEIHGTAYMVMDFEDGLSLSRMLKNGTRFNERSLLNIIRPIAEGLERAHRVGVLHRDIKPPNILVNPDGRPVLIDFGSARFEAAEATSTNVTFHTPPYAAIEQYVRTYAQGPWTDIYALGVVLHECITGDKPPEVLERMHGGQDTPITDGHWPGYSPRFLEAVGAAMLIRPSDRPQSISAWLAMFDDSNRRADSSDVEIDDEATRFATYDKSIEAIVPVAPLAPSFVPGESLDTGVPADRSEVEFKIPGQDGGGAKRSRVATVVAPPAPAPAPLTPPAPAQITPPAKVTSSPALVPPPAPIAAPEPEARVGSNADAPAVEATPAKATPKSPTTLADGPVDIARARSKTPVIAGAAALALLAAGAGWTLFGDRSGSSASTSFGIPDSPVPAGVVAEGTAMTALAPAAKALVDDARQAGAPALAVEQLSTASDQLLTMQADGSAPANVAAMNRLARTASVDFADALQREDDGRVERIAAAAPWADPRRDAAAAGQTADRQAVAATLRNGFVSLRAAVAATHAATDAGQALGAARTALARSGEVIAAASAATQIESAAAATQLQSASDRAAAAEAKAARKQATAAATVAAATPVPPLPGLVAATPGSATTLSASKSGQLGAIVAEGRAMARQVSRMGDRRLGANATDLERRGDDLRRANVRLAAGYDKYLGSLEGSMRGVRSDKDADRLIAQARQTRAYLQFLVRQSSQTP